MLGCSHTFEPLLKAAQIPLRYQEQGLGLSLYVTNIETNPAGIFRGKVIASMRPIPKEKITKATVLTARYPRIHGGPIHIGYPELIGVDLENPFSGDLVQFHRGDVPVFWACGVTPQYIAINTKIPFIITHAPGHMFITDLNISDLEE